LDTWCVIFTVQKGNIAFSPTAIMEGLNAGYSRRKKKDIRLQRTIHFWGFISIRTEWLDF